MYDAPKYPADFSHFDYVNPDAPKGGDIRLATIGGFDSLNPYVIKGDSAAGLGLTYDSLMVSSASLSAPRPNGAMGSPSRQRTWPSAWRP
jgi:microcin C transport system substrate-binding protein